MKRFFLSAICLALLPLVSLTRLSAQQAPSSSDKIIVVQKTQNADGTTTIKKKSLDKGQDAETYLKELNIDQISEVTVNKSGGPTLTEITIVTDGAASVETTTGDETIFMIRQGDSKREIKWRNSDGFQDLSNEVVFQDRSLINDMPEKAFLGIYPETNETGGVLLTDVVSGTGADAAGLKAGDVMTAIDGETLTRHGDLTRILTKHEPGDVIAITFTREGQTMVTNAELTGKRAERWSFEFNDEHDPCKVFIGVYVGNYGEGEGIGVSGIVPGWPAEEAGLQAGDRIIALDGKPVDSHTGLVVERDRHQPGDYFTITYLRDGVEAKTKAQFKPCPKEASEPVQEVVELPAPPAPVEFGDNSLQLEELNAYPNPTFGDLNVGFKGQAVPTTVRITDVNGKTIYQESLPNFDGNYSRQLDVSKASPGTLLLSVQQEGKVQTKPIVLLNRA